MVTKAKQMSAVPRGTVRRTTRGEDEVLLTSRNRRKAAIKCTVLEVREIKSTVLANRHGDWPRSLVPA